MKDYYVALGVPRNASKEDIVRAYRKGAQTHHPDRNPGDSDAEKRFREIQEAYEILNDPEKRAEYDSGGHSMHFRMRGFEGNPFTGSFGDIFQNSSYRGRNLTVRLEIDLSEAYSGCIKEIIIKVKNTCTTCKGQGQVSNESCANCNGQGFTKVNNAPFEFRTNCSICNGLGKINPITCVDCNGSGMLSGYKEKKIQVQIPCGVDSGINLKMSGQGEESIRGGNPGDLIVHILVKEHDCFQREGIDLLVDVPLAFSQLTFGCEVEIPTICDEMLTCKIPTGTQSHAKFKLGGKGMKLPNGVYGDMIVTVKVEVPKGITSEYKEAILKLQDFEKNNFGPRRQRWLKIVGKKDK